jgi:hypothetical protein
VAQNKLVAALDFAAYQLVSGVDVPDYGVSAFDVPAVLAGQGSAKIFSLI